MLASSTGPHNSQRTCPLHVASCCRTETYREHVKRRGEREVDVARPEEAAVGGHARERGGAGRQRAAEEREVGLGPSGRVALADEGDLAGVRVYKFDCINQLYLLAYLWDESSRTWLAVGPHENFYRDLKR